MDVRPNGTGAGSPDLLREELQLKETGRVEAFSDGVFAIAATLLVLTLAVPAVKQTYSAAALKEDAPDVIDFATREGLTGHAQAVRLRLTAGLGLGGRRKKG